VGAGYVLVAAFLGHGTDAVGHAHGHAHSGGDSHYGVDGSGHGSVKTGELSAATFHFPFFSPLALATLGAAVGAWGLIAQFCLKVRDETSLVIAVPAALATAYVITYASWRLVRSARGTNAIRVDDLAGVTGEVITPIPAGGVGEVAAMVGGQRYSAPARDVDGSAVARGATVTVVRMISGTLIVKAG